MALFDALGELVGAAVLTAGPVCDLIVPSDVAQERGVLYGWLQARGEAEPLVAVVDALAREIWVGVETRGLSQQALAERGVLGRGHDPVRDPAQTRALRRHDAPAGASQAGVEPQNPSRFVRHPFRYAREMPNGQ